MNPLRKMASDAFGATELSLQPRCGVISAVTCHNFGFISDLINNPQKEAADANAAAQAQTNASNVLLNLIARGMPITPEIASRLGLPASAVGAGGAILPWGMSDTEQFAGANASNLYRNLSAAGLTVDDYKRLVAKYGPSIAQNDKLAEDIASGKITEDMLTENQPVAAERLAGVETRKNAGLEALAQTLNEIDSIQAGKGFSGDSTGNRTMRFNARRQIGTATAADLSNTRLQNAMERQSILSSGRNLRLSNLDLPTSRARSAIDLTNLPSEAVAKNASTAFSTLAPFNIGPHAFTPFQTGPLRQPIPSWVNSLGQDASSAATSAGRYFTQRDLQNRMQPPYAPGPRGDYLNETSGNPYGGSYIPVNNGDWLNETGAYGYYDTPTYNSSGLA